MQRPVTVAGLVAELRAKGLSELTPLEWVARFIARFSPPLDGEVLEMGNAANDNGVAS